MKEIEIRDEKKYFRSIIDGIGGEKDILYHETKLTTNQISMMYEEALSTLRERYVYHMGDTPFVFPMLKDILIRKYGFRDLYFEDYEEERCEKF